MREVVVFVLMKVVRLIPPTPLRRVPLLPLAVKSSSNAGKQCQKISRLSAIFFMASVLYY